MCYASKLCSNTKPKYFIKAYKTWTEYVTKQICVGANGCKLNTLLVLLSAHCTYFFKCICEFSIWLLFVFQFGTNIVYLLHYFNNLDGCHRNSEQHTNAGIVQLDCALLCYLACHLFCWVRWQKRLKILQQTTLYKVKDGREEWLCVQISVWMEVNCKSMPKPVRDWPAWTHQPMTMKRRRQQPAWMDPWRSRRLVARV